MGPVQKSRPSSARHERHFTTSACCRHHLPVWRHPVPSTTQHSLSDSTGVDGRMLCCQYSRLRQPAQIQPHVGVQHHAAARVGW